VVDRLGNTEKLSPLEAVRLIELDSAEGLQAPGYTGHKQINNIFGRPITFSDASDLSFLMGLASTGLRAGALVDGRALMGNFNQLSAIANQHLATVIHCSENQIHSNSLSEAGFFQTRASNSQEAADFSLIAHRIAELSLVPGICGFEGDISDVILPSKEFIVKFLGDPDSPLESPTPSQKIIFGPRRRRVPNWFSLDNPMTGGSEKGKMELAFESAANQKYFIDHLPDLIQQAFDEYNELSGKNYSPVSEHKSSDADHLILVQGSAFNLGKKVVDSFRTKGQKVGCLNLSLLIPFPEIQLIQLLEGKKSITVLEKNIGKYFGNPYIFSELLGMLQEANLSLKVYSGQYGDRISDADIASSFINMANDGQKKFFLGLDFTNETSKFPKHEVLLGAIKREYPSAQKSSLTGTPKTEQKEGSPLDLPSTIRKYLDKGPPYTKLSRFFDDTGYFYQTGNTGELVADPYQAIPVVPSGTANFSDLLSQRENVPQFNAKNCSGCGDCFVNCPHSAIPPIAIGLENLIKAGSKIASGKGTLISKLTPQVKNLAKLAESAINEDENNRTIGDCLKIGFDELVKQLGLEGEKLEEIKRDFDAIQNAIIEFPSSITDSFFKGPNAQENGAGELFSLAIDPHACTGCGVCEDVCNDEALEMVPQTPEILSQMQSVFKLWEQLPDTDGETIRRLHHDQNYNPFAAVLLSRNYYMSMTGGSQSEQGAPTKTIIHLVTSATESAIQPRIIDQIKELDELIAELNKNIHQKLSEALPMENFDSLEKAAKDSRGEMTPFDDVIRKMGEKDLMKQLDTDAIQRKIELTKALKDLKWSLSQGPTGTGRSRYGMTIAGQKEWLGEYPYNNFTSPTAIQWDGAAPELAMGLFQGTLRYLLDNIKIMRRAKLESKDKYDPNIHNEEIAGISWQELSDDEKAFTPPILVVGNQDAMSGRSGEGLSTLLAGDWPIKVVLVNNAYINPESDLSISTIKNTTTILSAMALKNAFVLQGSMGNPSDLYNGIFTGMTNAKPALFNIFAPDQNKHKLKGTEWSGLANMALNSRAFPSLRFNPEKEQNFLGSSLNLDANPEIDKNWHTESIPYLDGDEEKTIDYVITWADWAYTLKSWESQFSEYKEEDGAALPMAEYIALEKEAREGKVPIIIRSKDKLLKKYKVSQKVVTASESILMVWNTWLELAGMLSEFPEELRKQVESELSKQYENDLTKAREEFNVQLKEQEKVQVESIRKKLKDKLVALSKQGSIN
jgi:pyruvate/2-oxoacid:ferredoxin oxidoreductase alpha subunit/ferredoxin